MLAYVFWHWPRSGVDPGEYERMQRDFHAALAVSLPPGFLGSSCHRISGADWAAGGGIAYEDWYLQESSAALDELNAAAVTAGRRTAHDLAAALAAGGTAGLYHLQLGGHLPSATLAGWFRKPEGWSYARLLETMQPLIEQAGGSLWMRRMVLGPTPEFCFRSIEPVHLPRAIEPQMVPVDPVWPV